MRESLLVVGAGCLGRLVGEQWRQRGPVLAETKTEARHESMRQAGLVPRLRGSEPPPPTSYVVFSVPPSAVEDYPAEASRAVSLWQGGRGLVMVSSTGVYAVSESVREKSPTADTSRSKLLLDAERVVLEAGGVVVRMAGLYNALRGPHQVYLRRESSPRGPDGLINLIHYDDAATLVIAALTRGVPGTVYLGCDNHPITREDLLAATLASPRFRGSGAIGCRFEGATGQPGKTCDGGWTRIQLGWEPLHSSFRAWALNDGGV